MSQQTRKHFFTLPNLITGRQKTLKFVQCRQKFAKKLILLFACALTQGFQSNNPAFAKVAQLDQVDLAGKHYAYLYQWSDPETKPKAIVIALHGIAMHGLTYKQLASHLAEDGAIVFSPDLPGCGRRWLKDDVSFQNAKEQTTEIIESAKKTYKNIPVFVLGESLGANLSLAIAEYRPDLVDGIILSSPALKRRVNVTPKIVVGSMELLFGLLKTDAMVDLSPYVRNYASEDPLIIQTMLNDPLVHRQMKCQDLWDSCNAMKDVCNQAKLISKTTPVLIMQGSQDRILKADAVIKLVSKLASADQTVKWYNDRGHMLLEECQPKPDVMQTLDDWFNKHIDKTSLQARTTEPLPVTSSLPPLTEAVLNANTNSD
jgi:acylglycerol lipase